MLEAFAIAHAEIIKLCDAQEDLRRQAGKPKWLDSELTKELTDSHGPVIASASAKSACARREHRGGARERALPELSMDSTEEDILRRTQVRSSLNLILEQQRLAAVQGPVTEQFGDDLRALTDAEQDSKELKAAKRSLLFERIVEGVQLPFPVGQAAEGEAPSKDSLTKSFVRRAPRRPTSSSSATRSRSEKRRPDGRATDEIRPIETESPSPAHARVGPLHPRADADHDAPHPWHGQGGAADRRPVARERAPLHAPLQLPALLGRGDGLHAGPEAA